MITLQQYLNENLDINEGIKNIVTNANMNFKIENNRKELQIGGEWEDEER